MSKKVVVLMVGISLVLAGNLFAVDTYIRWTDADPANNLWSTAGNWDMGRVPNITDTFTYVEKGPSNAALVDASVLDAQINHLRINSADVGGAVMNMTGGKITLATGKVLGVGYDQGTVGTLNMSDGMIIDNSSIHIGAKGNGFLYMTDGYIKSGWGLYLGKWSATYGNYAQVHLDGGEIEVAGLGPWEIYAGSFFDITGAGKVTLIGDHRVEVEGLINLGRLTGDGSKDNVMVDYNTLKSGYTTVYAIPEPATIVLLSLCALALRKRK